MQESRNPDAVREWLDTRVNKGFNQKAIKAMLQMSLEELAEVCSHIVSLIFDSHLGSLSSK